MLPSRRRNNWYRRIALAQLRDFRETVLVELLVLVLEGLVLVLRDGRMSPPPSPATARPILPSRSRSCTEGQSFRQLVDSPSDSRIQSPGLQRTASASFKRTLSHKQEASAMTSPFAGSVTELQLMSRKPVQGPAAARSSTRHATGHLNPREAASMSSAPKIRSGLCRPLESGMQNCK